MSNRDDNRGTDITHIREFALRVKTPAIGKSSPGDMTPALVGRYYDVCLSRLMTKPVPPFMNYGYWTDETRDLAASQLSLMDQLLSGLGSPFGRILDVACGMGATTRFLSNFWKP